jgi:hypothetical protein
MISMYIVYIIIGLVEIPAYALARVIIMQIMI